MRAPHLLSELNAQLLPASRLRNVNRVTEDTVRALLPHRVLSDMAVDTTHHDKTADYWGLHYSIRRSARSFVQLLDTGRAC
jgi:hypothetical protein